MHAIIKHPFVTNRDRENNTFLENIHHVHVFGGFQIVSNIDDGMVLGQSFEGLEQIFRGFRIQCRSRLCIVCFETVLIFS